jgi:hypothetical protein
MNNATLPSETAQGRAWLEKYLHPPSVARSNFVSCPDNNLNPVTTLNFETVTNIPLSCTIAANHYNIDEVFFLQTTGARVVSYVFVRLAGQSEREWIQHPQYPAIVNDSYDFVYNWGNDVSMQRMSYKSCTYYLNSTSFNDQGTVTIAQQRAPFFNAQTPVLPPVESEPANVADSLSWKIRGEFDYNKQLIDMGDVSGQSVSGQFVPASPTQVQQSSPRATTHLARLGAFVPQHWSQPINRFYNNVDTGNGSPTDLVTSFIRFLQQDESEHTVPLFVKNNPDGTVPAKLTLTNTGDTPWSDFTVAHVYFSALSVSPTLGQTIVSAPYITVKCVYGIEVQPHTKSSLVFFQQVPPVPDDKAIHVAAGIVHQKPDGYVSSANDFGSILSLVTKFAPPVINWLSNAFGANAAKKEEKAVESVKGRIRPPRNYNKEKNRIAQLEKQIAQLHIQRRRPKKQQTMQIPVVTKRYQQLMANKAKHSNNGGTRRQSKIPLPTTKPAMSAFKPNVSMNQMSNPPRGISTRLR